MPEDMYLGSDSDVSDDDGAPMGPAQSLFLSCRSVLRSSLPDFIASVKAGRGSGECDLSFSEHHKRFVQTVEGHLEECVLAFGFPTLGAFVTELRGVLDLGGRWREGGGEGKGEEPDADDVMKYATARELLDIIDCVKKFENFAEGMRIKSLQYLEHVRDGKPDDDAWTFGRRR